MAGQGQRGDYGRVTQVGQAAAQRGARAKGAQRPALPTVRPRYAGSPGAKCQERRSQRSECNVVGLSSGPAQRSTAHCSAQLSTLTGLDLALSCSFLPPKRREATPTHPTVRRSESRTSTQYRHSLPTPALPGNEIRAAIGASIPPPACHSRLPDSSILVHTPLTSPPVHAYYSYWNKTLMCRSMQCIAQPADNFGLTATQRVMLHTLEPNEVPRRHSLRNLTSGMRALSPILPA